jgi:hypothetical protein
MINTKASDYLTKIIERFRNDKFDVRQTSLTETHILNIPLRELVSSLKRVVYVLRVLFFPY